LTDIKKALIAESLLEYGAGTMSRTRDLLITSLSHSIRNNTKYFIIQQLTEFHGKLDVAKCCYLLRLGGLYLVLIHKLMKWIMMKAWTSLLLLYLTSLNISASPIYYTFEGFVNDIAVTSQGGTEDIYKSEIIDYANSNGLGVGSAVSYTIMVDKDYPGTAYAPDYYSLYTYKYHYDGQDSNSNGLIYDNYYAELIDGNVLDGWTKEYNNASSLARYDTDTLIPLLGHPYTSFTLDSYIEIHNAHTTNNLIDDLFIGEEFLFTNTYDGRINTSLHLGYIHGSLNLVNISTIYPVSVPEPPLIFLFIPALAVLVGVSSKA